MRKLLYLPFLALALWGQKTPNPNVVTTFFDSNGIACALCKLYTYAAGGTTPIATYTTPTGVSSNTNPITLNAGGQANVWLTAGTSYRFDLYTSASVLVWSKDNIPGGTLAGASTVPQNYIFAGPASGGSGIPGFRQQVQADLPAITPSVCTNQFLRAFSAAYVGTCDTVVAADFGTSIPARSALANPTAAAAAPAFGTTLDMLAYQVAEIPAFVRVSTDFTTSGVGTALETITGLTWTIPANTALNVPFRCSLIYSQAVANDVVALGIQDVTVSPTNIAANGLISTSTTTFKEGALVGLASTTATSIVSTTPAATATDYLAEVSGFIEAPSNASSSVIRIMVSTATAADLVTIRRGSFCRVN